jgi:hypothetical protein
MKNGRIGWIYEFKDKLDHESKVSLTRKLNGSNVLRPDSVINTLEDFIKKIKYKNMVIWYKSHFSYVLIINPNKVELFKDYRDIAAQYHKCNMKIDLTRFDGEGLRVIQCILKEILDTPIEERMN